MLLSIVLDVSNLFFNFIKSVFNYANINIFFRTVILYFYRKKERITDVGFMGKFHHIIWSHILIFIESIRGSDVSRRFRNMEEDCINNSTYRFYIFGNFNNIRNKVFGEKIT